MAATNHDDLDMARLQKKITQQQRDSTKARTTVTKLTPAEIRSLNYSVSLSKDGSARTSYRSDSSQGRSHSSNTPPSTPENVVANQKQTSRNRTIDLPTPPHSPDAAHEIGRNSNPTNGYTHIHAPKPHSYNTAQLVKKVSNSRPSSAASYRGMQTYRGPEVTRTGSLTMLHQPPSDIVSNPLSQFSRPRRSQTNSSPDRRSLRHSATSNSQDLSNMQDQPQQDANYGPIQNMDSQKVDESTVSTLEPTYSLEPSPIIHSNGSHGETKPVPFENPLVGDESPGVENRPNRNSWTSRRSMSQHRSDDTDLAAAKKHRRNTLSHAKRSEATQSIPYSNTKPGAAPILRDSLKGDLPSDKTSAIKDQENRNTKNAGTASVSQLDARPLSVQVPDNNDPTPAEVSQILRDTASDPKGKGREPDGSHVNGRCYCCGKPKKPNGFHSALAPVMENENTRTNFSSEADRPSTASKTQPSAAPSLKGNQYMPIGPMPAGNEERVRSNIDTYPEVFVNKPGDIIASNLEPVAFPTVRPADPTMVRFSSLHGRNDQFGPASNNHRTARELTNGMRNKGNSERPRKSAEVRRNMDEIIAKHLPVRASADISDRSRSNHNTKPVQASAGEESYGPEVSVYLQMTEQPSKIKQSLMIELPRMVDQPRVIEHRPGDQGRSSQRSNDQPFVIEKPSNLPEVGKNITPMPVMIEQKATESVSPVSKGKYMSPSTTKEKTTEAEIRAPSSKITPDNTLGVKHQNTPGQASGTKSPQKISAFARFRRQRNVSSLSNSSMDDSTRPITPPRSSSLTQQSPLRSHPVVSLPPDQSVAEPTTVEPTKIHNLVTVPSAESSPVSIVNFKEGILMSSSVPHQPEFGSAVNSSLVTEAPVPWRDNSTTAHLEPRSAVSSVNSVTLPSIPTLPLLPDGFSQPSPISQLSETETPTEILSYTEIPYRSWTSHEPWPLPAVQVPTIIPLPIQPIEQRFTRLPLDHIEQTMSPSSVQQPEPIQFPSDSSSSSEQTFQFLPALHMGPHFDRSNLTLREYVIPRGKSNGNLMGEALNEVDEHNVNGKHTVDHDLDSW